MNKVDKKKSYEGRGTEHVVHLLEGARQSNERMSFMNPYTNLAREDMLEAIRTRGREIESHGDAATYLADPYLKHLQALKERFAQVEAITKGLIAFQGHESSQAVFEQIIFGIESLMGIELEARASQARIALSAVLEGYVAPRQLRPAVIEFEVGKTVREQFRLLQDRVKLIRENDYGLRMRCSDEDLVGLLIALGTANMPLLSHLRLEKTDRATGSEETRVLKFSVDARVFDQFKALANGVSQMRSGKQDGWVLGTNAIFAQLVGLGIANTHLLASLGVPNIMAVPLIAPKGGLHVG